MTESFAPSVNVPGYGTVTPPGWMWVLGFAIGGCEWAIKEAGTEEFRIQVRKWYREQDMIRTEAYVVDLEKKLCRARLALEELTGKTDDDPQP